MNIVNIDEAEDEEALLSIFLGRSHDFKINWIIEEGGEGREEGRKANEREIW